MTLTPVFFLAFFALTSVLSRRYHVSLHIIDEHHAATDDTIYISVWGSYQLWTEFVPFENYFTTRNQWYNITKYPTWDIRDVGDPYALQITNDGSNSIKFDKIWLGKEFYQDDFPPLETHTPSDEKCDKLIIHFYPPNGKNYDHYEAHNTGNCPNSASPTHSPTKKPTGNPSKTPTNIPTKYPTTTPSITPTLFTNSPTIESDPPTKYPSDIPSNNPSKAPTFYPSEYPSNIPSNTPTKLSNSPSLMPTIAPSKEPSNLPSNNPSNIPSISPTNIPSIIPTSNPSEFVKLHNNNSKSDNNGLLIGILILLFLIFSGLITYGYYFYKNKSLSKHISNVKIVVNDEEIDDDESDNSDSDINNINENNNNSKDELKEGYDDTDITVNFANNNNNNNMNDNINLIQIENSN